ncbi:hypothetical protein TomTYG45_33630 [Sphingobium sp. TomTYG45]
MGAVTNIFRRGAIYYFRRQLRWSDGAICAICLSLRTARLAHARHVATLLSAMCERAGADRNGTMAGISVSHRQRNQLFQQQLQAERDMLCEWRAARNHGYHPRGLDRKRHDGPAQTTQFITYPPPPKPE